MPFIIGFLSRLLSAFFGRLSAWVVGLFATLSGPLTAAFLKIISNASKVALGASFIIAALITLSTAMGLAIDAISFYAPNDLLVIGEMIMPNNMSTCISLLILLRVKSLIVFWVVRLTEKLERT